MRLVRVLTWTRHALIPNHVRFHQATLLTYPIQIAQNRLRSSPSKRGAERGSPKSADTMLGCLADMVQNEGGLPALYKGKFGSDSCLIPD